MYGQEIQLLHYDSNEFLITEKECANRDKSCNKVWTDIDCSDKMHFWILPKYKYWSLSEEVYLNDQVIFLNESSKYYLHYSSIVYDPYLDLNPT